MSNEQEFREGMKVDIDYKMAPIYEEIDSQKVETYRNFVLGQKAPFWEYLKYLNEVLIVLKDYRIVSDYTQLSARIKSTESAVKNDNKKALNDIFGIEIDFATPGEKAFIIEILKRTLTKTKESVHNKSNGYVAHHYSGYPCFLQDLYEAILQIQSENYDPEVMYKKYLESLPQKNIENLTDEQKTELNAYFKIFVEDLTAYKKKISFTKQEKTNLKNSLQAIEKSYAKATKGQKTDYIPIIECQFKTIQVAIEANLGAASHGDYKGVEMEKIQEEYNRPNGIPLSRIPTMYASKLEREDNGEAKVPTELSSDEALRKLYPLLRTNTNSSTKSRGGA